MFSVFEGLEVGRASIESDSAATPKVELVQVADDAVELANGAFEAHMLAASILKEMTRCRTW